jgi:hypothetical protein
MTSSPRKFELSPKRMKENVLLFQLVDFAILYEIHNKGYCHLLVATMAILAFEAMCRYSEILSASIGAMFIMSRT